MNEFNPRENYWEEIQLILTMMEKYSKKERKLHLPWFYDQVKDLTERYKAL